MIRAHAVESIKKHKKVQSYKLRDENGSEMWVKPESIKEAILKNQISIDNMTITKDGVLTMTTAKPAKHIDTNDMIGKTYDIPDTTYLIMELAEFLRSIYSGAIELNKEFKWCNKVDIFIPDKSLAINIDLEQCSSKNKSEKQKAIINAERDGIHLMYLYSHELVDNEKKEKIHKLLRNYICDFQRVYARNTEVVLITSSDLKVFEDNYHLQGYSPSTINLALVDKKTRETLQIMTFGSPRFNNSYEYELVRACTKHGIRVIGGSEKLFKAFLNRFKPNSVISYCDIDKFNGTMYSMIGMKLDSLSDPGYVWYKPCINEVLPRYRAQKHKLLSKGLGKYGNTETEIMTNIGYLKIYNGGNKVFTWLERENR